MLYTYERNSLGDFNPSQGKQVVCDPHHLNIRVCPMSKGKTNSAAKNENLTQIFFDGDCPLCKREIEFYKSIEPPQTFEWRNLWEPGAIHQDSGFNKTDAMKSLHVLDTAGRLHTGVDAFAKIWDQFPKLRWLSILIKLPVVYQLACAGYACFARLRLLWR